MSEIFTIGYASRTLTEFIRLLERYEIQYLIDVRSVPASKQYPEFSKGPLSQALKLNDLEYVFMGDLLGGRPQDPGCYTPDNRVDYEAVKTKEFFQRGIARLIAAAQGGHRVALMCSEIRPHECHRAKLIAPVLQQNSISVVHIDEAGDCKTQDQIMDLLIDKSYRGGQKSMFGEENQQRFTSRKSYVPGSTHGR